MILSMVGLEGGLLCRPRVTSPAGVAAPEGVEQRLAVLAGLARLQQAEEVVDAVLAGEGVALEVQVEVAGAGLRQRQQALGGVELAVLASRAAAAARRCGGPRPRPGPGAAPARARAPASLPGCPPAVGPWAAPARPAPRRVSDLALDQLGPGPRRDVGHQREMVIRPASLAADLIPAADAAVLDRLRVRRRRGRVDRVRRR